MLFFLFHKFVLVPMLYVNLLLNFKLMMYSRWESAWNPEKWNETTSQTGIQFTLLYGLLDSSRLESNLN